MQTDSQESLNMSPIFAALTRPVMLMGVTLDYLSIEFIASICLFILGDNFFYLLVFLPLHIAGYIACKLDPYIFRILIKRADCAHSPNRKIWGCQSYEPF